MRESKFLFKKNCSFLTGLDISPMGDRSNATVEKVSGKFVLFFFEKFFN